MTGPVGGGSVSPDRPEPVPVDRNRLLDELRIAALDPDSDPFLPDRLQEALDGRRGEQER